MTARFRKGDSVSVTGKVKFDQTEEDATVFIDLDGYHSSVSIKPGLITLVRPRIDVGEIVHLSSRAAYQRRTGTVLAVNGDWLWVDIGDGVLDTWAIADIHREPATVQTAPIYTTVSTVLDPDGDGPSYPADIPPSDIEGTV